MKYVLIKATQAFGLPNVMRVHTPHSETVDPCWIMNSTPRKPEYGDGDYYQNSQVEFRTRN
jgi:hypothetical protein